MTRRSAFTLIELLVVLGVVALLVGLLLPVLGSARAAARSARCLSNARHLTLATLAYVQDFDGRLPCHSYPAPTGRVWWFGFEPGGPGGGLNRPLETERGPLAPYFGGDLPAALACPDFPADDPGFVTKFARSSAHYGYNGGLVWPFPTGAAARRLSEVPAASATFLFADAVHRDGAPGFYEPHSLAFRRPGKLAGTGHFRHPGETLNAAWLDGHAAARERPDATPVWETIADAPAANLDVDDGPDSVYGFRTWTF